MMLFRDFDAHAFLRDYWQKRPLLIRSPWQSWTNPLSPDELAGLACEDDVESRLVERTRKRWRVDHGPFAEKRFSKLGKHPWTLLVQAVDHHVPAVAALIAPFRFIPNWRIDDVMVSYASDGGGVGPHFDNYDVFLIQGLGRRRWRVGQHCDAGTPLLPNDDLRLLADFDMGSEWVLEPGDILYLPPGVAHDGVAVGEDCMTYSIGFRAPSRSELVAHWCDHLLAGMAEDDRYSDPGLNVPDNAGEIADDALSALHAMVAGALSDRDAFARWFGAYSTAPKYPDQDWRPDTAASADGVRTCIAAGTRLVRNPASRFSYVRTGEGALTLFVDGESFECRNARAAFAETLCQRTGMTVDRAGVRSKSLVELIVHLLDQGSVSFDHDG